MVKTLKIIPETLLDLTNAVDYSSQGNHTGNKIIKFGIAMAIPQNSMEVQALTMFRTVVADLGFEDGVLMRFLRARDLDKKKAEDMLRKFVVWRSDAECNKFISWKIPSELFELDIYLTGFDYEGRPVFWAPMGHWPLIRPMLERGMVEDILKFAGKHMNKVYELLLRTKHQQFVAIADNEGLTFRKVFSEARSWEGYRIFMGLLNDYEANFPELLNSAFMVNTPLAFMWGWKIFHHCLTDHTLSKVNIFGTDETEWKPVLQTFLPDSAIPPKYGGSAILTPITDNLMARL